MDAKDDEDYYYGDSNIAANSSRSGGNHESSSRQHHSSSHKSRHHNKDDKHHKSKSKRSDKSNSKSSSSHRNRDKQRDKDRDRDREREKDKERSKNREKEKQRQRSKPRRQHGASPSLLDSNTEYITKEVERYTNELNNKNNNNDNNEQQQHSGTMSNENRNVSENGNTDSNHNNNNNNNENYLGNEKNNNREQSSQLPLSPMSSFNSNVGVAADTTNAVSLKRSMNKNSKQENDGNNPLRNFEFSDPLESHKRLILQTICSDRIAWYYNDWLKTWDVVYKIEESEQNENFWIVTDSHQNYYAMHRNSLYSIAPSDQVSVKHVVTSLLDALKQKFLETALFRTKPVMCEFTEKSDYLPWHSQSSSFQMCKIDDYHIEGNVVNGFFVSPMGNDVDNDGKPTERRKLTRRNLRARDEHCHTLSFVFDNFTKQFAFDAKVAGGGMYRQRKYWHSQLNELQNENRNLKAKLCEPTPMEMERLRLALKMRNQLEEYILTTQAECEYIKKYQSSEQAKYESQLSDLKGEINSLKNTLKSKSGAIVALEKENTHKIKAIHELTQQIEYLREKYETHNSGSGSSSPKDNRNENANENNNNNNNNRDDRDDPNSDSENEKKDDAPILDTPSTQDGSSPKKGHGRGFSIVLTSPNETLKTLVDHKAKFTEEEKARDKERSEMVAKLKEQENIILQLKKDIENLNSKNETMTTDLYNTQEENKTLKTQMDSLTQLHEQQRMLIDAQQRVQQQQGSSNNNNMNDETEQNVANADLLENIQNSLQRLDRTMEDIKSEISIKKIQKTENDSLLNDCEQDLEKIKEQFANEINRRLSETTNTKHKQVLDGYKQEIEKMTEEKEYLEKTIESAETGLSDFVNLKEYLTEAKDKITVLENENHLLKQDVSKNELLLNEKNIEIESLKIEINKLTNTPGGLPKIKPGTGIIPENIETDVSLTNEKPSPGGGSGSSHRRLKSKTQSPFVTKKRKSNAKHKQSDSLVTVRMDDDSSTETESGSDSDSNENDNSKPIFAGAASVGATNDGNGNTFEEYVTGLDRNKELWKNENEVIKYWDNVLDEHHTPLREAIEDKLRQICLNERNPFEKDNRQNTLKAMNALVREPIASSDDDDDDDYLMNELLYTRYSYEFLFDILKECEIEMKARKKQFIDATLQLFSRGDRKGILFIENMAKLVLQNRYQQYIQNEYSEFGSKIPDIVNDELTTHKHNTSQHLIEWNFDRISIDSIIDDVYDKIMNQNKYKSWTFMPTIRYGDSEERGIKDYISQCCKISWIMAISMPEMSLSPQYFTRIEYLTVSNDNPAGDNDGSSTTQRPQSAAAVRRHHRRSPSKDEFLILKCKMLGGSSVVVHSNDMTPGTANSSASDKSQAKSKPIRLRSFSYKRSQSQSAREKQKYIVYVGIPSVIKYETYKRFGSVSSTTSAGGSKATFNKPDVTEEVVTKHLSKAHVFMHDDVKVTNYLLHTSLKFKDGVANGNGDNTNSNSSERDGKKANNNNNNDTGMIFETGSKDEMAIIADANNNEVNLDSYNENMDENSAVFDDKENELTEEPTIIDKPKENDNDDNDNNNNNNNDNSNENDSKKETSNESGLGNDDDDDDDNDEMLKQRGSRNETVITPATNNTTQAQSDENSLNSSMEMVTPSPNSEVVNDANNESNNLDDDGALSLATNNGGSNENDNNNNNNSNINSELFDDNEDVMNMDEIMRETSELDGDEKVVFSQPASPTYGDDDQDGFDFDMIDAEIVDESNVQFPNEQDNLDNLDNLDDNNNNNDRNDNVDANGNDNNNNDGNNESGTQLQVIGQDNNNNNDDIRFASPSPHGSTHDSSNVSENSDNVGSLAEMNDSGMLIDDLASDDNINNTNNNGMSPNNNDSNDTGNSLFDQMN